MPDLPREMVVAATGGRARGPELPVVLRGVSTDTRTLQPGALFVALTGERFDGHDFVAQAFQRQAGAALVSREMEAAGPLLLVPDTLQALGSLAARHRSTLAPRVVAITGSTGKTTTKEMIAAVLARGWRTAKTPGNYNNEIGVPLAVLDLEPSHEAIVVELAMRGRGQIGYLAHMAQPQVGVVTNIGLSHLELLGSRRAIAETKAELLAVLPERGAAVLNADDEFFSFLREHSPAPVISFGYHSQADVRVDRLVVREDAGTTFVLTGTYGELEISLRAPGRHHALNAAAAAAAAFSLGAEPKWITSGLAAFEGADMRSRIAQSPNGYLVIDDCYNAAPDSMRVALELLADLPGEHKWAALGDMKELGPLAPEWHREIGELAAAMGVTGLITLGELGHHIAEGGRTARSLHHVAEAGSNAEAADMLRQRVAPGDVVLVKGSRAMHMEQIVNALLRPGGAT